MARRLGMLSNIYQLDISTGNQYRWANKPKQSEILATSRRGTMEALRKVWLRKEGERGAAGNWCRDGEEDEGQDSKKPEKIPSLLNSWSKFKMATEKVGEALR